ncbi:restriction endonuclease subunit S [Pseudomonas proteolytica]|uniref:restriction endonuclease subunit S n=1 Tax=Pseudomonas proteolytica TaxID=219574 RepID=UPI0030D8B502
MTFPSYPEYKEAGVEWLGEVPEHWCSAPIKYMALERNSLFLDGDWIESKDISSDGIRYITTGNVGEGAYKEQGAGFISEETFHSLGCTEVYEGDVLISRLNNPIGRACITPDLGGKVVTSVDNVIFRPDAKYHKKFIVYLFSSEEYFKHTGNLARGATMQRISRGLLGNIRIVTPSLAEQTQIARFLDHETARIDALIEEQQRLIELLKEKRQAAISLAVIKGLDPTVPMKDSGVEWLGEVPAHWVVSKFGYISSVVRGGSPRPAGDPELFNGDYSPWVTVAEITKDDEIYLDETETFLTKKGSDQCRVFSKGTLLLSNSGATLGVPKILMIDANANDGVVGFENISLDKEYSYLYLATLTEGLRDRAAGSGQPNLNTDIVKSIDVPVPPSNEVAEIVAAVKKLRAQFNFLSKEAAEGIRLLQERRSALISAAVTGKIDVRGWQPPASVTTPELVQEAV